MDTRLIVGIGVVVLVIALVIVGPNLATSYARNKKLSECEALKAELAALRIQGGDVNEAARLEARIAQCAADAESYGADLDLGKIRLGSCDAMYEQMEREFAHYRSTSYDDPVKRNNTRQTILRIGSELSACYSDAISQAESVATLDAIKRSLLRSIAASTSRRDCFLYDQTGCGRFGLNEDHGNDKARAEEERVLNPLQSNLSAIEAKRSTLARFTATGASRSARFGGGSPLLGV